MRRLLFTFLIFSTATCDFAQVVTTNPSFPSDKQQITITFDAAQGNQGLKGFTGDIYAHTGVITDLSTDLSDWKYIKAAWGVNIPACKMTSIGNNKYTLVISPDVLNFYGVPQDEKILQLAFVFRDASGNTTGRDVGGKDIFADVYQSGLNVKFIYPTDKYLITDSGNVVPINVSATKCDSVALYDNGVKLISIDTSNNLSFNLKINNTDNQVIVAKAYDSSGIAADTFTIIIKGNTVHATLPLGVHDGINYIDDQTVTFVLFAPYKKFVYLLGDFNNWVPDNNFMMKKDSDRFWITLNGLTSGKEYIFQYFIDGNIRIADPYCEKISDPSYDKNIPGNIYPDLIKYPAFKTNGIAGVIQTAQTPYNWQATTFSPPDKNKLVIYELLIRDFTANKDIKTVTDSLPYLIRLGVNAIELMPFNEFDGNDSWGYNPCFYFAPDKAYGTKEDYKKFIDVCHQNGIAVIQDMVLDFSTNNSPLVQMYYANGNPSAQNPWYDTISPNTSYVFGNVFNHASPYTRKLTDSITSFWMSEYKIDGFRFDFAKGWTNTKGEGTPYDQSRINNLELAADHIWKQNPKAYVILELFTANSEETVLANYGMLIWGNMNTAYCQAAMSYNDAGGSWNLSGIFYKNLGWNKPGLVGYMESHDEQRVGYKCITWGKKSGSYDIKQVPIMTQRLQLDNLFFIPVPGPKMIWQFGELGYDIPIDSFGRTGDKPVKWDYFFDPDRKEIYNMVRTLNKIKLEDSIFNTTNFKMDVAGNVKKLYFSNSKEQIVIVGNFDVVSVPVSIKFSSTGLWYDVFNKDSITLLDSTYNLNLNPGEYKFYSTKMFKTYLSLTNPKIDDKVSVFPNPFNDHITINGINNIKYIELYNVMGHMLFKSNTLNNGQLTTNNLKPGFYFLKIILKNGSQQSVKLIK